MTCLEEPAVLQSGGPDTTSCSANTEHLTICSLFDKDWTRLLFSELWPLCLFPSSSSTEAKAEPRSQRTNRIKWRSRMNLSALCLSLREKSSTGLAEVECIYLKKHVPLVKRWLLHHWSLSLMVRGWYVRPHRGGLFRKPALCWLWVSLWNEKPLVSLCWQVLQPGNDLLCSSGWMNGCITPGRRQRPAPVSGQAHCATVPHHQVTPTWAAADLAAQEKQFRSHRAAVPRWCLFFYICLQHTRQTNSYCCVCVGRTFNCLLQRESIFSHPDWYFFIFYFY